MNESWHTPLTARLMSHGTHMNESCNIHLTRQEEQFWTRMGHGTDGMSHGTCRMRHGKHSMSRDTHRMERGTRRVSHGTHTSRDKRSNSGRSSSRTDIAAISRVFVASSNTSCNVQFSCRSSALQYVAVCCSVLQCAQCSSAWYSVVQLVITCNSRADRLCCSVLQGVAVCCNVLQCMAVWCSVL